MNEPLDISVVITTCNRSDLLSEALEGVLTQDSGDVQYEVIAVDNNSKDNTREVIEDFIARGNKDLRYVFEPRQGVACGRNAGIAAARGEIIAFTDDDVVVTPNWVATIKRAFDENQQVDVVGGKILPRWTNPPPPWLTTDHWWPLALLDCGDRPFYVNATNPLCLPTANASFRRRVFESIGGFSTEFSTREDHELQLRMWQAGLQGFYEPELVVMANVQPERLQKSYHHRWNTVTGKFNSLMRLAEILAPDGSLKGESDNAVKLFGVSASMYREFLTESIGLVKEKFYGNESRRLQHENRLWYVFGYVSKRYEQTMALRKKSALTEITGFARDLWRKKVGAKRDSTSSGCP